MAALSLWQGVGLGAVWFFKSHGLGNVPTPCNHITQVDYDKPYPGIVRMLVRIPHPDPDKAALLVALVDMYNPLQPKGRSIEAMHIKYKMYPVLLQDIRSKLVSCHPNGFMIGLKYFMPYVKSGFMASD